MNKTERKEYIGINEIMHILFDNKIWIISVVFLSSLVTAVIVIKMPNIYETRALLLPQTIGYEKPYSVGTSISGLASIAGVNISGGNSVTSFDSLNAILKNGSFLADFVKKNKFESKVLKDPEEQKSDKFVNNVDSILTHSLLNDLTFYQDSKTNMMELSYKNKDRQFSKLLITKLLHALSEKYKSIQLKNIDQQIDNYKYEISSTQDITLKNKLSDVVASLIQNKVLAQAHEYYGFDILVNPVVPDSIDKVSPKRSLICVIVFVVSLFLSSAFFVIKNVD